MDVKVTTAGGASATSSADQFTYSGAPTVSGLAPGRGPASGGTPVVITGAGFTAQASVRFGATAAANVIVSGPTSITATSPAGSGTVEVKVTTTGGTSTTSVADEFTYVPAPAVTTISPSEGPVAGATQVTITGTDLADGSATPTVQFGSGTAGVVSFTATSVVADSPPGDGTVEVTVTTDGGTSSPTPGDLFTYTGLPSVSNVSPGGGPLAGGTLVTLTGVNFTSGATVSFGGVPATPVTFGSDTSLTVKSPAGFRRRAG